MAPHMEPGIKPRRQSILIGQRSLDVYAESHDQGKNESTNGSSNN